MTVSDTPADTIRAGIDSDSGDYSTQEAVLAALDALVAEVDRERARADRAEAAYADARDVITRQHAQLWAVGLDRHVGEEPISEVQAVANLVDALSAGSGGRETTP